jgi:hypothetical protein
VAFGFLFLSPQLCITHGDTLRSECPNRENPFGMAAVDCFGTAIPGLQLALGASVFGLSLLAGFIAGAIARKSHIAVGIGSALPVVTFVWASSLGDNACLVSGWNTFFYSLPALGLGSLGGWLARWRSGITSRWRATR